MRNFILGIAAAFLLLVLGSLAFAALGLMPTNADATPPALEIRIATNVLDTAMNHRAQHLTNPVPSSDGALVEGMKLYTMNCSMCHGTLDNQPSPLAHSLYPPAPQLILDPVDDPEWRTYFVIKNGIRYTGMPAWSHSLTDQDIWKVTDFLSRVQTLPPPVQDVWSKSYGVRPISKPDRQAQTKGQSK